VRKIVYAWGAYVLILGAFALWRWHVWTYGADTGLFTQVIADAFGGFRDGPEQGTHFRFHWAPLLATLWPLVALTRAPVTLQLAQLLLISSGVFPLYALARRYLGERLGFGAAAIWLLYPAIMGVAFTEFHEIAFYPPLVFGLVWAADRERWGAFAIFAALSALVREEACIVLAIAGVAFAGLGIVRARRGSRTRQAPDASSADDGMFVGRPTHPRALALAGIGLTAVNVCALAIYYLVVIPRVGPWEPSRFYLYPFANGPLSVAIALLTHPGDWRYLAHFGRLTYALEAFAPLAFLPFFSRWSLLAFPGLAIVLLSSDQIAWRMGSHYPAIFAPWLVIGALGTLVRWHRAGRDRRVVIGTRAALVICALVLIGSNPLHPAHYAKSTYDNGDDVTRALASIPSNAYVALHDEWYTHIAADHPNATVFFCPYVDYLVYADDYHNDYFQTQILPEVRAELASGQTRVVARFGHVAAYARTPDRGAQYGRCLTARDKPFATLREFLDYDLSHE
jgi:uncharacterized membrane protein